MSIFIKPSHQACWATAMTILGVIAVMLPPVNSVRAQSLPDALVAAYLNSPELASSRADVKIVSE